MTVAYLCSMAPCREARPLFYTCNTCGASRAAHWSLTRYWALRYDSRSKRRLRDEDRAAMEQLQKDVAALQEQMADVVLQAAEDKPRSLKE